MALKAKSGRGERERFIWKGGSGESGGVATDDDDASCISLEGRVTLGLGQTKKTFSQICLFRCVTCRVLQSAFIF